MESKAHKAGFVNIIGKPNVGKSTLMNALVGEKLSIITSKAQTTRHRIQGIVNGEDFQIVYSDTPGILDPNYKLQENMLKASRTALVDADILLYVTEAGDEPSPDYPFLDKIQKAQIPVLLVINKIDLTNQERLEDLHKKWEEILPDATIIPLSALKKFNLDLLFKLILDYLPEGDAYYPKEELSDKSERFFAGEIIREKILMNYKKEVPYSVEIEIPEFKEDARIIRIEAVIYVERETQKGILIGKAGSALKQTGTDARLDLEQFFDKKVFLSIVVKVKKDWRSNENHLRAFGYR
ncbi:MAG: GTPase Era [Bacteroidales bacterium]|nr:GTPase Era [Bacteroidales bacterium]